MPAKQFPSKPDLNHLKYQAKDLLKGHAAHDRGVAQRIREFNPRFKGSYGCGNLRGRTAAERGAIHHCA